MMQMQMKNYKILNQEMIPLVVFKVKLLILVYKGVTDKKVQLHKLFGTEKLINL